MRIVAGIYGGRLIKAVPSKETRPTTDRVREAWASVVEGLMSTNLTPAGLKDATVCDVFAGSGALGIEMLSRGAGRVVFCEQRKQAQKILRENLDSLDVLDSANTHVITADVFGSKAQAKLADCGPYELLILDPPYATDYAQIAELLGNLVFRAAIKPDGLISYEQSAARRLPDAEMSLWLKSISSPADTSFILETRKLYGTVALDYFRYFAK